MGLRAIVMDHRSAGRGGASRPQRWPTILERSLRTSVSKPRPARGLRHLYNGTSEQQSSTRHSRHVTDASKHLVALMGSSQMSWREGSSVRCLGERRQARDDGRAEGREVAGSTAAPHLLPHPTVARRRGGLRTRRCRATAQKQRREEHAGDPEAGKCAARRVGEHGCERGGGGV